MRQLFSNKSKQAKVQPGFVDFAKSKPHAQVYQSGQKKKPLKMFVIQDDPSGDPTKGYYYVQREGINSVAFLLVDYYHNNSVRPRIQVLSQWHGPTNQFNVGAFTGSLEKPEISIKQAVIEEVKEEAGYDLSDNDLSNKFDRVTHLGESLVSGNTNETVHLFLIDITGLKQEVREPENLFEENMTRFWISADDALSGKVTLEIKAMSILFLAKAQGFIYG